MDPAEERACFPASEQIDGPIARVELSPGGQPVFVSHSFSSLELRLGDGLAPAFEVVSGLEWPQVRARYVVTQPTVLREDPHRGWAPVGGVHPGTLFLGPGREGGFSFASTEAGDWLMVRSYETFLSFTPCGARRAVLRTPVEDLLTAAEASSRSRERPRAL